MKRETMVFREVVEELGELRMLVLMVMVMVVGRWNFEHVSYDEFEFEAEAVELILCS